MGSKVEYVETSQIYATNYVRNAKAVGVLWGIFTLCFALIVTVCFLTPEWIGVANKGRLGLWSSCEWDDNGIETCEGKFTEFIEIANAAFKISTVLSLVSVGLAYLTIVVLALFLFMQATSVYMVAAWLQIIAGKSTRVLIIIVIASTELDADSLEATDSIPGRGRHFSNYN